MKKFVVGLITTLFLWGEDKVKVFLDLAAGVEAYKYEEKSVMTISGPMYRVDASLGLFISPLKIQLEGYYSGDMDRNVYDGAIILFDNATQQTSRIPYSTRSKDWYAGGNLKVGLSLFPKRTDVYSFIYAGVGYRFLKNHVIDKPGIKASYPRNQIYLYLPIGVDTEIPITDYFSFVLMTEYRFFLKGMNKSGFSKLGYEKDLLFTQKEGFGGKVAVAARFHYGQLKAQIGLYYDYWFIEDSDKQPLHRNGAPTLIFIEPKNNTKVIGLMAGIIF